MREWNQTQSAANANDDLDVRQILLVLWHSKRLMLTIILTVTLLGAIYAYTATPVYQSDVLVQFQTAPSRSSGARDELNPIFGHRTPVQAELELLRSRSVMASVVDQLNLDIVAEPVYMPVIGRALAQLGLPAYQLASVLPRMNTYAWGDELVSIERLDVPHRLMNSRLTLRRTSQEAFELIDSTGARLLTGRIGEEAVAELEGATVIRILVSQLETRPQVPIAVMKKFRSQAADDLRNALRIIEHGTDVGIVRLALEGHDPQRVQQTLASITDYFLRQNVARRSKEAEKTLDLLNKRLPALQQNVERAERRLNSYRSSVGSVDVGLEAAALLDRITAMETQIAELRMTRDEVQTRFTPQHPQYAEVERRIAALERERATLDAQLRQLPDEQERAVQLERDVRVANELYLRMLQTAQELRVTQAGPLASATIVDPPFVAFRPTKPNKTLIIALSLLIGTTLGIFGALIRHSWKQAIDDPNVLEHSLQIPVYASLVHSDMQSRMQKSKKFLGKERLLALADRQSPAVEALRCLRTHIHFAPQGEKGAIIAITGPAPNIGKSFVSANLAAVFAAAGRRVLLIDGDMRKGQLHDTFAAESTQGLSNVLDHSVALRDALHSTSVENLQFLSRGPTPPNPSELLLGERFHALLRKAQEHYDLVVIDTPPALAATDATIIGRHATLNLMVLRAGTHSMREIKAALQSFQQSSAEIHGLILNRVTAESPYYTGYHYQYSQS